jgi:tetratricopeptide (TPR) repeat protein
MGKLRVESRSMPAADLGPENPLPPIRAAEELHAVADGPAVPEEIAKRFAYGHPPGVLPYTMQDGYNRDRHLRDFCVAVLENEFLRATFLLELGGRLWSLVHKPSGRELLDVNPVFQPANLAIRNAWFSGGVEWNIGVIGHSPFTCSPLFAARAERPDGTPILRMYEWERIRQVPFQIDAYLPDGSSVLFVRVRIVNPHDWDVPIYWWSNMAVPEAPDTRVIVPADAAYGFNYSELGVVPVPEADGIDITYAANINRSTDFFFHVAEDQHRWIAALDGRGRGLVQVSTDRLGGRKLFVWGMGTGGRNWQEFLSLSGQAYIEIQAGLARTQMEYLRMPAGAEWSWLEAYGLMETDPAAVHGSDWTRARQTVEGALERLISRADLDAEFERGAEFVDEPPVALLQRGSGWGALERLRRAAYGEPPFCSEALVFDDESLGEAQAPWIGLLRDGALSASEPDAEPRGFMVQAEWRALLEDAVGRDRGANWLAWLHLGVMRHHTGDRDGARRAWEQSLEQVRTPWALRNLAVLALEEERFDDAAELYVAAHRLRPSLLPLAVECGRTLIDVSRPREWLEILAGLPASVRAAGRIRLLEARAALAVGDFETVERIFAERPVVDDLREGEVSLSHLWFAFHEQRLSAAESVPIDDALRARVRREFPVPHEFDFRVVVDESAKARSRPVRSGPA